mmetsp:Transcript_9172/g.55635  ORF Transcript_9172/g.55635 Transcript_9172/m.55635 type:complete len:451 (+) Transcript_9172:1799-3151(+)
MGRSTAAEDRVGCMYDYFLNHRLPWPTQTCRWGPVQERGKNRTKQTLYVAEQTDGSVPNTIVMMHVEVPDPRTEDPFTMWSYLNASRSQPIGKRVKTIRHAGEVNVLRDFPVRPNLVCTHTDAKDVYVWNLNAQPPLNKSNANVKPKPDVVLKGHEKDAMFALSVPSNRTQVASGGQDSLVITWNLEDEQCSTFQQNSELQVPTTCIHPRAKLVGHKGTVDGVALHPMSEAEVASVGTDRSLIFWDTRDPAQIASKVEGAHTEDIACVDWHSTKDMHVATGGGDRLVKVWDRRMIRPGLHACIFASREHKGPLTHVAWCPQDERLLASGGEDGKIMLWNLAGVVSETNLQTDRGMDPLMFEHKEHSGQITDLGWNPHCPMTLISSAVGLDRKGCSQCTLQSWRITDLIFRNTSEVLNELETFRDFIMAGKVDCLKHSPSSQPVGIDSCVG